MNICWLGKILSEKFGNNCQAHINNASSEILTLLTDSRNYFNPKDTLFFAIKTPGGNDGHKFIKELYDKGVRNFIVEYSPKDINKFKDTNFFIVPDTIEALTSIGKQHLNNAEKIIAITGSRGKTTLKEMMFQLLSPLKKISRSPRSFNSKIGVPLSLWQIAPQSELAIIETGISEKGEMDKMAPLINPDTVIITNVGEAHDSGFDSKEQKAAEKVKLAQAPNVKKVIFPLDDHLLNNEILKLRQEKDLITWSSSNPEATLFSKRIENGISFRWKNESPKSIEVEISDPFDFENINLALAFMLSEGFKYEVIKERFKEIHKISTRLNVTEGINGCSLIMDSYTSDLSSLLPAIDFMRRRKMPRQSLTLIMSDVRTEGLDPETNYNEIADLVKNTGISKFIGVGKDFCKYACLFSKSLKNEGRDSKNNIETFIFPDTSSFLKNISASDFNDEIILIKGSPDFEFQHVLQLLEAKKHETVLEVNLDGLLRNYNYFKTHFPSSTGVIAMVKAFGYGAGSYEIAKTLQDAGAAYLAVAAVDEGIALRNQGIVMPIMVMNPKSVNYQALSKYRLQPVIYSLNLLKEYLTETRKGENTEYPVHIKLDTGMHRMGFEEKELPELISLFKKNPQLKVSTVFSHLATADCLDMDDFTMAQFHLFEKMSNYIIKELGQHIKRHILNSAGIIRFPEYHYDYVRLGIGLYGANTLPENLEEKLSTVASLKSVIITIREILPSEAVGYSRKGKIERKSRIATMPIGYADGMNRRFGNGAIKVLINGKLAPTIGNICMDATMIDVTDIECNIGDSVEIFGENIDINTLSETIGTIPYEILTSVSLRVKRIYFRE